MEFHRLILGWVGTVETLVVEATAAGGDVLTGTFVIGDDEISYQAEDCGLL